MKIYKKNRHTFPLWMATLLGAQHQESGVTMIPRSPEVGEVTPKELGPPIHSREGWAHIGVIYGSTVLQVYSSSSTVLRFYGSTVLQLYSSSVNRSIVLSL